MSGRPSRLQPNAGLSKSSALSHAYIQYPPLRCSVPGPGGLFFDDGNKLLICPTVDQVIDLELLYALVLKVHLALINLF